MARSTSLEDMFDFTPFPSASDANTDGLFGSSLNFASPYEISNDPAPAQASNVHTVSPKDVMVDSMSAPPSGAFTDLTTPGTNTFDSPYMTSSTDPSPLFSNEQSFGDDSDQWPSLFGELEEPVNKAPAPVPHFTTSSPVTTHVAPKMSRNDSSPGQSSTRSSNQGRHSVTAGVAPKRRDKPLPAIHIDDPTDSVAVKRARNTLAARKSREKRMERTEALISQVNVLETEVEHWRSIAISMGYTK